MPPSASTHPVRLRIPVGTDDHLSGPIDAPLTLVEYGDFECPECGRAFLELKRLRELLGPRLCFVFRNFPLAQEHPHAVEAAQAAEAAGAQGHYWEMHDMLFESQRSLVHPVLMAHADALGLDLRAFIQALREGRFQGRIHDDFLGAVRSGVLRPPAFFLNGQRYQGALTEAALVAASQQGGSTVDTV